MKKLFLAALLINVVACELESSEGTTGEQVLRAEEPLSALSAKYPAAAVEDLLRQVRAALPEGWRASYEKEYSYLQVARDRPVLANRFVINGTPFTEPKLQEFGFSFRVLPYVRPEDYRRWRLENVKLEERRSALYEELVKRRVGHKFDSFIPRTDQEKAAVAEYEALKGGHPLPDFYFGEISLRWIEGSLSSNPSPDWEFADERVGAECRQVQSKVLSLLSTYEAR